MPLEVAAARRVGGGLSSDDECSRWAAARWARMPAFLQRCFEWSGLGTTVAVAVVTAAAATRHCASKVGRCCVMMARGDNGDVGDMVAVGLGGLAVARRSTAVAARASSREMGAMSASVARCVATWWWRRPPRDDCSSSGGGGGVVEPDRSAMRPASLASADSPHRHTQTQTQRERDERDSERGRASRQMKKAAMAAAAVFLLCSPSRPRRLTPPAT